jgi:tetratricopeptide (TPR) repeat protein
MSTQDIDNITEEPVSTGPVATDAASDFFTRQWKVVAGVLGVVVVVVAGYFYMEYQNSELNIEGLTHLSRVRLAYDMGQYDMALTGQGIPPMDGQPVKGLVAIGDEYSGTAAGEMAAMMAGNAYINLGKASEATSQFEKAASSDARIVQVGAVQGLAAALELGKNFSEAASKYEEAAKMAEDIGLEEQCYLSAAACYEEANNKDKASELYRLIVKKFEMSEVAASAKSGLARLGTAID